MELDSKFRITGVVGGLKACLFILNQNVENTEVVTKSIDEYIKELELVLEKEK